MKNVVAKDLRSSDGKYRMRVEPSEKHYTRNNAAAKNEIAALLDDHNDLTPHEEEVLGIHDGNLRDY